MCTDHSCIHVPLVTCMLLHCTKLTAYTEMKFMVSGRPKQAGKQASTHFVQIQVYNAVMLVWGLLRLTPIMVHDASSLVPRCLKKIGGSTWCTCICTVCACEVFLGSLETSVDSSLH